MKSVVTWVLAEVGYALEVIKGLWLDFWDLLSGMVPDWVKEVGGWFGDLLGGWFGDLFSGIDDLLGEAGHRVELKARVRQEETERRRRFRRIEAGEEEFCPHEQTLLNMLRDPVTPVIWSPKEQAETEQAATNNLLSETIFDQRTSNRTVNARVTVNANTDANPEEIAAAATGALTEALHNLGEDSNTGRSE